MTPETRTSLTTAVFVVVPVVIALAAFTYLGPGGRTSRVTASSCGDLTSGTYWALEFNNDNGTPGNPAYVLATIDLSSDSRGGLKHNVEVNWKTPHTGTYATETTSEYDFDPASNCSNNGTTLLLQADDTAPSLTVTFTGGGTVAAHGGNPSANWKGSIVQIP